MTPRAKEKANDYNEFHATNFRIWEARKNDTIRGQTGEDEQYLFPTTEELLASLI